MIPLKAVAEWEDSPLVVEAEAKEGGGKFTAFRVGWKAGRAIKEGIYNVIVTPVEGGATSLTVPIHVLHRKG